MDMAWVKAITVEAWWSIWGPSMQRRNPKWLTKMQSINMLRAVDTATAAAAAVEAEAAASMAGDLSHVL